MVKLVRLCLALLVPAVAAGGAAPAVAAPADDAATVAGVLQAQRELTPERLRSPRAAATADGLPGADFPSIASGAAHTCVTTFLGSAWCWGANADGQLGTGTTSASSRPVRVRTFGVDAAVLGLTAGRAHTCASAIDEDGFTAYCWGANDRGQLGDGSTDPRDRPAQVASAIEDIAAGADHTCSVSGEEEVSCWGANDAGQLGAAGGDATLPQPVAGLTGIVDVAAGGESTCALDDAGEVSCWGALTGSPTPAAVTPTGFRQIGVGRAHACGVVGGSASGGRVYCWGENADGQLGTGNTGVDSAVPVRVAGARTYVSVSASGDSTCALTAAGQAYCWGDNGAGQLGTGDTVAHGTPVAADQSPVRNAEVVRTLLGAGPSMVTEVGAGPVRSCVVAADSRIHCTTSSGELAELPLAPGPPRSVAAVARDRALRVTWGPPARSGAAPVGAYAALAVAPGSDVEELEEGTAGSCATEDRSCTITDLANDRRYAVFVMAVSEAGLAYSAVTEGTPNAGGAGGGLPVSGPGGPLVAGGALLALGVLLTALGRRRDVG